MAKIEKIGNIQIVDNKEDKFFYFPMISMACTGYRCGVGNRGMNTGPRFFAARGWIGSGRNICR